MKPQVYGAVVIETSVGRLVAYLYGHDSPTAVKNFIGLSHAHYFNGSYIHHVLRNNYCEFKNMNLLDGESFSYGGLLAGDCTVRFRDELNLQKLGPLSPDLRRPTQSRGMRIERMGLLLMGNDGRPDSNSSKIIITLSNRYLEYLQNSHTIFGEIVLECPVQGSVQAAQSTATGHQERHTTGAAVLSRINNTALRDVKTGSASLACDEGSPVRIIRIKHTYILHDPFGIASSPSVIDLHRLYAMHSRAKGAAAVPLLLPSNPGDSPLYDASAVPAGYLSSSTSGGEEGADNEGTDTKLNKLRVEAAEARVNQTRTLMLQVLDAIPDSSLNPPEDVIFVCKLNPITTEDGLRTCFGQFGRIVSCEVIRDRRTGNSLQYAFIEFETVKACEKAYAKMDNVRIDDSRIHVDFSQSVSKVWAQAQHQRKGHQQQPPTVIVSPQRKRRRDENAQDVPGK